MSLVTAAITQAIANTIVSLLIEAFEAVCEEVKEFVNGLVGDATQPCPYDNVDTGNWGPPVIDEEAPAEDGEGDSETDEPEVENPGEDSDQGNTDEEDTLTEKGYIIMHRVLSSPDSTLSTFYTFPESVSGFILEPKGPSIGSKSGTDQRIPGGNYSIVDWDSTAHPNSYRLTNDSIIPGRGIILIHSGNEPAHTEGCLLPGDSYEIVNGDYFVYNSTEKTNALYSFIKNYIDKDGVDVVINELPLPDEFIVY